MIVGCYTLDLYCDRFSVSPGEVTDEHGHWYNEFPHQFTAELGSECRAKAKQRGWKLNLKDGTALCPKCSGKRKPAGERKEQ